MAQGISITEGTPRTLTFNGAQVATGGSNRAGLYSIGSKLYFDGTEIADSQNGVGLHIVGNDLYFGSDKVGSGGSTPVVHSGLWLPPTQEASTYNKYTYNTLIAAYDDLKDNSSYPGTITKHTYSETSYGDYPLYHYRFSPAHYTKTFYVQACIHGNEKDAPQTILRIFDIICNHANESAYSRLAQLRDHVRFIVVPCVSPWGFDNSAMNVPWTDWNDVLHNSGQADMMNMNRNFDMNHQYTLAASGRGGNYPNQNAEVRHVKSIIDDIGTQNIDYAVDCHDGGDVYRHLWINYNADGANAPMVRQLVQDLLDEEERLRLDGGTDYRDLNNSHANGAADVNGYVHPNCCDEAGYSTGVSAVWFNTTMGMLGSVCEYIGGYFGYTFDAEQMTRSLRIRANLLIYAYEMISTKGWLVNEAQDAEYFHFDYPISMTRQGLRKDGVDTTNSHTIVTIDDVYARWDALAQNYPTYVSKSSKLGENSSGDSIYSYTLGSGNKKVLFLGGAMRWSANHKETEYGMYVLAEYLCNDYVVNQSAFLQTLKQNYTIVVLPCIDINGGGNSTGSRERSLNTSGLGTYCKWANSNDKCVASAYGQSAADATIFMDWITENDDALVLVSGGEDCTGYSLESPAYETDYMTQFIKPKNLTTPAWLTAYCGHLEDDRGEDAPDVEATNGLTCGDYAYDNFAIPTFFINLKVSQKWAETAAYQSDQSSENYMYRTYETGRRIANIVNFILMAGGDINND